MPELKAFASSVAIVISSCDAFFDTWRPFLFFFRQHWPNCPFPVYLIVNRLRINSKIAKPISVGRDRGWASNLMTAVDRVPQPYILYFQDDYFLTGRVQNDQLADDFAYVFENGVGSLCLHARGHLEPNFKPLNDRFGIVPRDSDGRTRLQVTVWRKEVLRAALRPGESAWDMEARGSDRTRDVLSLSYIARHNRPIPYLMSAIVRGLWTKEAITLCAEQGIGIHPRFRSLHSNIPWRRRLRRSVDRARFAYAIHSQRHQAVDLEATPPNSGALPGGRTDAPMRR